MNPSAQAIDSSIAGRRTVISSRVFGVLLFVFVDVMFFSALISSYFVIKRGREVWDIPGTVHLPVAASGFNTGVLFLSGLSLFLAGRALGMRKNIADVRSHLTRAIVLAGFFVIFQFYLGLGLVNAGLTMKSNIFGGCYFLMVGAHGLQVLFGILAMVKFYFSIDKMIDRSALRALQTFWLFVVGVWPVLYVQIYF